jgi:hypothetical protein
VYTWTSATPRGVIIRPTFGERGERRDHVVRLPALELEVPVPERLDDGAEVRELLAQEVRHRAPIGLVLGRDLGAVHGPRVPRHCDPARRVVGQELEEHVREAEERVRELTVGRLELLGQREEGAVGEVVAVDEEELGVAYRGVVELELLAGQRLRHALTLRCATHVESSPRAGGDGLVRGDSVREGHVLSWTTRHELGTRSVSDTANNRGLERTVGSNGRPGLRRSLSLPTVSKCGSIGTGSLHVECQTLATDVVQPGQCSWQRRWLVG